MLKVIKHSEVEKWDTIVTSFKNHDIYYYYHHAKLYDLLEQGTPLLFYYADETARGIHVTLIRDISKSSHFTNKIKKNTYFDLVTPYGYGGFLIEGVYTKESQINLKNEYLNYCQENNIISEFIKFHPLLENHKYLMNIFKITKYSETVILNLEDKKKLWNNYKSSNRQNIRKAKKSNIKISWSNDSNLIIPFKDLYEKTMDKANANAFYYFSKQYYDYLIDNLDKNFLFFYAKKDQKIIAMSIVFLSNKNMHYHLSASDEEYRNLYPTNYLINEAALWGHHHGFLKFHLGGGLSGQDDTLLKFKKKFDNKNTNYLYTGEKIYNREIYEYLTSLRTGNIREESFFPIYRSQKNEGAYIVLS